jgi:hypothetical protein
VVVNGQEITLDLEDDFKIIERIFDEFENDNDTLAILFPVTVKLADHAEMIINNAEELEEIIEHCIEGGNDDDIECVDFRYPLTFTVYHSDNQLSDAITINDDQELHDFFDTLLAGDIVSFKFPVTVILPDGAEMTIHNNDELEDIVEEMANDCDEDDDNDYNDDDADDTALVSALTDGVWEITYFFDDTDETDAFAGFMFTFNADGTGLATDGGSSVNGTWKSYGDDGVLELEFDFGEETPFDYIQEDFEVDEFSASVIKLKEYSVESEPLTALVFEKR